MKVFIFSNDLKGLLLAKKLLSDNISCSILVKPSQNIDSSFKFRNMNFDSVTINPYMGSDSVTPFLEFENKISILLGLTSNKGANDIQLKNTEKGLVFMEMIKSSKVWGNKNNMMYVVGATKPDYISKIRSIIPDHFLLMPGVGAQGGDLDEICKYALNDNIGVIVNSSRSIIYASNDEGFALAAADKAMNLQNKMRLILSSKK